METKTEPSILDNLRNDAVNEVSKDKKFDIKRDPMNFIKEVGRKFIEKQLDSFPEFCMIARVQNKLRWDELKETSNKGKYTDTYGWSPQGDFKFDYEIPDCLYMFMTNLVYKNFWDEDNEKIWRPFMRHILRGDDPMTVLMKVKSIYGSNAQKDIVLNNT